MSEKFLSARARDTAPSPTLAVTAKARELAAKGKDICGFGAGEPDFDTPDFVKEGCIEALRAGKTKYAPVPGIPELRDAVAERCRTFNRMPSVKAANVVISPGGKYSCYLAIQAVIGPGDEAIIPAPYWVSYPEMVTLSGGKPVIVETADTAEFKISPEQLRRAITPRTKLVILNSPSNPTGAVYTPAELRELMEVARAADIMVMSDEIYDQLLYDGCAFVSPASFSEDAFQRTITVGGFSKTFSMTGWRLGTLIAPTAIANAIGNLQSQTTSNATTFAQYGALAALRNPAKAEAFLREMLVAFDRRRLKLLNGLNAIPGIRCYRSTGAFYLFPNIAGFGMTSVDFCSRLLEQSYVAAVPGIAFGSDAYMRLSYACDDATIEKGIERIAAFAKSLHKV